MSPDEIKALITQLPAPEDTLQIVLYQLGEAFLVNQARIADALESIAASNGSIEHVLGHMMRDGITKR